MHMKKCLSSQHFEGNEELQSNVEAWLKSHAADFYEGGISKLVKHYGKCHNVKVNYAEK